jgi:hypothetical protein
MNREGMKYRDFKNMDIKKVFRDYPTDINERLLFLRELIFSIAEENSEIGEIEETLKWDNPSYLTTKPKSGTTIRLSGLQEQENNYAISVHCQTTLISEFKEVFPNLKYDGNRSIVLDICKKLPLEAIERFIYLALTYHYRRKLGIGI